MAPAAPISTGTGTIRDQPSAMDRILKKMDLQKHSAQKHRVMGIIQSKGEPTGGGRGHTVLGTVKFFNPGKGYGFIQPKSGGGDVFVHISAVERAGLTVLVEGQTVEYEEVGIEGKIEAENLKVK
jgi:CspA family cold shock protein